MKLMHRNRKKIYYCLFDRIEPIYDEDGNDTGEKATYYSAPVPLWCCVAPPSGEDRPMAFGSIQSYQYDIVTTDTSCPIDEHSVLFVDREPQTGEGGEAADCAVLQVKKYLNTIAYKVSRIRE